MNNPFVFSFFGVAAGLVVAAVTAFVTYQRYEENRNDGRSERRSSYSGRTIRKCGLCTHYIQENIHDVYKAACGRIFHQVCVSNEIYRKIPESRNHILFEGFRFHNFRCICKQDHAVFYKNNIRKKCSSITCSNKSVSFITLECDHNIHQACLIEYCRRGNIKCPNDSCSMDITETFFMKAWSDLYSSYEPNFSSFLFFSPESSEDSSISHYCKWCKKINQGVRYLHCGHYFHAKCFVGYYIFRLSTRQETCCPNCSEPIRVTLGIRNTPEYGSNNIRSSRGTTAYISNITSSRGTTAYDSNSITSSRGTAAYVSDNSRREPISERNSVPGCRSRRMDEPPLNTPISRETNSSEIITNDVCRDCKKSHLPVYLDCNHHYHSMCIMAKMLIKMTEGEPLVCPEKGCGHTISESKFKEIVIAVEEDKKGKRRPSSLNMDPDSSRRTSCNDHGGNSYEKSEVGRCTQNTFKDTLVNIEGVCSSTDNHKNTLKREPTPSVSGTYVTKQYEKAENLSRGSTKIELKANCSNSVIHDSPLRESPKIELKANCSSSVNHDNTLIRKITLSVSGDVPCEFCKCKSLPGELVLPCNHKFHPCLETVQDIIQRNNCLKKNCKSKFNESDRIFLMELLRKRRAIREKNLRRRHKSKGKQKN